jgi:hypothetical protein
MYAIAEQIWHFFLSSKLHLGISNYIFTGKRKYHTTEGIDLATENSTTFKRIISQSHLRAAALHPKKEENTAV